MTGLPLDPGAPSSPARAPFGLGTLGIAGAPGEAAGPGQGWPSRGWARWPAGKGLDSRPRCPRVRITREPQVHAPKGSDQAQEPPSRVSTCFTSHSSPAGRGHAEARTQDPFWACAVPRGRLAWQAFSACWVDG